ncbi:DUF6286 domain-containing protein [Streptomyces sp. NPDC046197]|uniref:DUF6286 domain-containing protein n=1 Tax=Streptomyces sp. NPDC046197 TaxID=3154337 RepID=UPI0033D7BD90
MSEPRGTESTTQPLPVIERAADDAPGPSEAAADHEPPPVLDGGNGRTHRFWSSRRIPAGIVALLLLIVAGAFLYDVVAVRAHRPGLRWRRELARQLAARPLDDTWVLVGAGVTAVLGLWLVVLAVTPGLRSLLPMRRPHPDVRAALHRDAAALVLSHRAMEIAGVQSVRVRLRRRRADVRALSHFRELDEVHADLDMVLADAIRALGLARPPALSVRVARPRRKG